MNNIPTPSGPSQDHNIPVSKSESKPRKSGRLRSSSSSRTISSPEEKSLEIPTSQRPSGPKLTERKSISNASKKQELKELVLEKAQKINPTVHKKVQIICRRTSDIGTLEALEKQLEVLVNDSNNQEAEKNIDKFFSPDLVVLKEGMDNIPRSCRSEIFMNERAKFIAGLLIDDEGNIDIEIISIIKDLINTPPLKQGSSKIHDAILLKTLDAIRDNQKLIDLLNSVEEPGKNLSTWDPRKRQIDAFIRATLGLDEDTPLTAMHSRQALLSALLANLRQGDVGSCFASAIAIMAHDQNPLQTAIELKQIIESGKFEKVVNGEVQTFDIPKISVPESEFEEREVDYVGATARDKFFLDPGIKKVAAMVGLDISKSGERAKLMTMFQQTLRNLKGPKRRKDVIRAFMGQLAMHKNGLEARDFEKRIEYERKVIEEEQLKKQLKETQGDEKKALIINQIEVVRKEMNDIYGYFDNKFGVGVDLKNKFEAYDALKQKLEMNYQSAIGENALLRTWEYSIAAKSNRDFLDSLINALTFIPISFFAVRTARAIISSLASLLGMQQVKGLSDLDLRVNIARKASVSCILNEILDGVENPDNSFNVAQFKDEFNENFKRVLAERLEVRYEKGHAEFYDATRTTSMGLAVPLEDPVVLCETIASIAYQAAENIDAGNSDIKDKVIAQLTFAIQEMSKTGDSQEPIFFKDLVNAIAVSQRGLTAYGKGHTFEKLRIGGEAGPILSKYVDASFEVITLEAKTLETITPEDVMVKIVTELDAMIKKGKLNKIDSETQIIFPVEIPADGIISGHAFLFRPDMSMLAELMKDPNEAAIRAWMKKKLVDEHQTFIFGDFNHTQSGRHVLFAIKQYEGQGTLKFFQVTESSSDSRGREEAFQKFTLHIPNKPISEI